MLQYFLSFNNCQIDKKVQQLFSNRSNILDPPWVNNQQEHTIFPKILGFNLNNSRRKTEILCITITMVCLLKKSSFFNPRGVIIINSSKSIRNAPKNTFLLSPSTMPNLKKKKKNICSTLQRIIVLIQYIPNRLACVKSFSLNESQSFYVLQQALKGFHQLFKKFGYFQICSQCIGFNVLGQLKCWISKFYESNHIQNGSDSIFGTEDGQLKSIDSLDKKLRDSMQKAMVCDLWQVVKKKSNVQSKDLFYRLSGLQNCNFQNAEKLIQLLIDKTQRKIPHCLYFQSCINMQKSKYCEFDYANVYNSQNCLVNFIQVKEKQIGQTGTFNFFPKQQELTFRDFIQYRQHIESLQKYNCQNNLKVTISFEKNEQQYNSNQSPLFQIAKQNIPSGIKRELSHKVFDFSNSTIPLDPSHKTIDLSYNTVDSKKQSFKQNSPLILQKIHYQNPVKICKLAQQRCILYENSLNIPSSSVIPLSQKTNTIQTSSIEFIQEPQSILKEQKPLVMKKTRSDTINSPIKGVIRKQSFRMTSLREPQTPQFTKTNRK